MKLLKLILENFKGIKFFTLDANGFNVDIYGDNATGKTTLADAYFWLLFGKDSAGRSDSNFEVKTQNTTGLDYSVTGTFLNENGTTFTLQRIYKEKFNRKNGEAEREKTGNTTAFFIDGVPKPKKDYTDFITSLCDEKAFYLLTDPDMFPGKMKPDERRDMLIQQFAPEIGDLDIINAHEELKPLINFIGFKPVEEYAEKTKYERQKINKQLAEIPGRIDEAEKAKPLEVPKPEDVQDMIRLTKEKLHVESSISSVRNGESASALRKKIADLEANISTARATYLKKSSSGNTVLESEAAGLRTEINRLRNSISKCKAAADNATNLAAGFDEEIQDLRQKCIVTASQEFNPADGVCPTCGREYPPEKLHDLEESFKENNARRLDRLEQKGKSLRKSKDDMLAAVEENKQKITADEQSLKQAEARLEQVSKAFTSSPPFESTAEYKKLQVSLTTAKTDLAAVESGTANQIERLNSQLDEVTEKIAAIKQRMAARSIAEQQDKRIEELKKQERELSELLATYDKGLLLAEKFVQTKALDIEHKVNSAFRLVRWKLFDIQVNGGMKACCEATVKGIEYNKNLNSAGKLNAGLDIINTLSRTVGISVPVWIDNAESVTRYFPIGAQVIRLHVSAKDKQLRVEVRG